MNVDGIKLSKMSKCPVFCLVSTLFYCFSSFLSPSFLFLFPSLLLSLFSFLLSCVLLSSLTDRNQIFVTIFNCPFFPLSSFPNLLYLFIFILFKIYFSKTSNADLLYVTGLSTYVWQCCFRFLLES